MNSKKHVRNTEHSKVCSSIPKVTNFIQTSIDRKRKRAELEIAAFIAEHCSINTVDHLGEVVKKFG